MSESWSKRNLDTLLHQVNFLRINGNEHGKFAAVYEKGGHNDIRHFISFHKMVGDRLFGSFAIREGYSHQFSVDMLVKNGGKLYGDLENTVRRIHTFVNFPFANFVNETGLLFWEPMDSERYAKINDFLASNALPFLDTVATRANLLTCLMADEAPCPWRGTNCAARAAQVTFLAALLKKDLSAVEQFLNGKSDLISASLSKEVAASDFITAITKDVISEFH